MGARRGLAVDGDDLGIGAPHRFDPACEALLEKVGIEAADHVAEDVVAQNALAIGIEALQEVPVLGAPQANLDEVVGTGERRAQHEQQHLGQRVEHLCPLPRVFQRR
jgi:hypothetical protein